METLTLDTTYNKFVVSKEKMPINAKVVIGPTNITVYNGKNILFNQKVVNLEKTYEDYPFFHFVNIKNRNIYILITEPSQYVTGMLVTSIDGKNRQVFTICK